MDAAFTSVCMSCTAYTCEKARPVVQHALRDRGPLESPSAPTDGVRRTHQQARVAQVRLVILVNVRDEGCAMVGGLDRCDEGSTREQSGTLRISGWLENATFCSGVLL